MNSGKLFDDFCAVARAKWHLLPSASVGRGVRVWGKPYVENAGRVIIRDKTCLVSTVIPLQLIAGHGATIDIGESCFINFGSLLVARSQIQVGAHCKIGMDVMLVDDKHYRCQDDDPVIERDVSPLVLEDNVWICSRSIVLGGVTIGRGSVVAAGSVVTESIPPRSLAAGRPARVVKTI